MSAELTNLNVVFCTVMMLITPTADVTLSSMFSDKEEEIVALTLLHGSICHVLIGKFNISIKALCPNEGTL